LRDRWWRNTILTCSLGKGIGKSESEFIKEKEGEKNVKEDGGANAWEVGGKAEMGGSL